jgi:TP901 family phage tail tape measure protein
MAGNTIQESTGMATGMIEVIQNAEKAGTILQTTSLRLRGMKGELEELGEDVDENVESISNMQTHILNLTHGKVNIFEDNGDFKSTYQILKDISAIYDSLKDTEQADLLETVAGKRNANGVSAIIQNWSKVEEATKAATNAEGTAAAENEKFMNSMQGKINATQAAWQAFSNSFLSSDFLKGLIDSGNTLLQILNSITKTLGSIPMLIGAITAAMSVHKNVGRIKLFILVNMPTVTTILFRYKKFRCYHY